MADFTTEEIGIEAFVEEWRVMKEVSFLFGSVDGSLSFWGQTINLFLGSHMKVDVGKEVELGELNDIMGSWGAADSEMS